MLAANKSPPLPSLPQSFSPSLSLPLPFAQVSIVARQGPGAMLSTFTTPSGYDMLLLYTQKLSMDVSVHNLIPFQHGNETKELLISVFLFLHPTLELRRFFLESMLQTRS